MIIALEICALKLTKKEYEQIYNINKDLVVTSLCHHWHTQMMLHLKKIIQINDRKNTKYTLADSSVITLCTGEIVYI